MIILALAALLTVVADPSARTPHSVLGVRPRAEPVITVPADGATLQRPPERFEITFPYAVVLDEVVVTSKSRSPVIAEGARMAWPSVSALLPPLGPGAYIAAWRVHDAAGHSFTGSVAFSVR